MLVILTTHPIQYQVPIWQALARRGKIPFEVWYLSNHGLDARHDREFGRAFKWDIDLIGGYNYRFIHDRPEQIDIARFRGAQFGSGGQLLLRDPRVSALWINGWQVQAYWQAAWQAHRLGIPVWLRGETNDLRRSHGLKQLPRWLALRTLFHCVARFLYIGSANRRMYESFGVPTSKLVAAPYCVDNDRFASMARALDSRRDALRLQWEIPVGSTCFLFSGKFIHKKRPLDLLSAVEAIALQQPDLIRSDRLHLLLVGDGELRPALEAKARELELLAGRPIVTFTGFLNQSDMPQAYVASDCLVLPSDSGETWGLVVNEALACGRSAIVSDQCGCAEDLARPLGEENVYPCGNVDRLAHSLRIYIGNFDESWRYECRKVVDAFSIHQTVNAIEHQYEAIF